MDGDRLAITVEGVDGRFVRWGGDEPDAEMIPGDLEFGTSLPGGYKDIQCSLFRRLGGDERLFDGIRAYGLGNRTAWDGRLVQFPRADLQVNPGGVGWASHLRDDPSFREIYINRDLGMFTQTSLARKSALLNGSQDYQEFSTTPDAGGIPSLNLGLTGPWSRDTFVEAVVHGIPGSTLARIRFDWAVTTATVNPLTANWIGSVYTTDSDETTFLSTTDYQGTASSGSLDYAPSTPQDAFLIQWRYSAAGGNASTRYDMYIKRPRVFGSHGLTIRGTSPDDGFYGHDLIQNIVSRTAPLLTATQGTGGIEANTSFVVPQAAFLEPTTGEDAVMLINGYFMNEWGVFDDKRFFWRAPDDTRLVWQARADEGAHVSLEGETAEAQYNGVLVRFSDPWGRRRIAGPPAAYWQGGTARADTTNATLVDTSTSNAVNRAGIPRRWAVIDVGPVTTDNGAVQLGAVWLAEHRLPQRRGTITISRQATHPTEGPVPPWRIRAGDSISTPDLADTDPKRIIETRYTRRDDSLVATVGNPDYKVDAILERLGVQQSGVI